MNPHDLETLLLCSFRYALGRSTYIVQDMCWIIEQHLSDIPDWMLIKMQKEINYAIDSDNAGMKCDVMAWRCLHDQIGAYVQEKKFIEKNGECTFAIEPRHICNEKTDYLDEPIPATCEHESDGQIYLTNPPMLKCKICGEFFNAKICKKTN